MFLRIMFCRVQNSQNQHVSVIDMELCQNPDKQSAAHLVAQVRNVFNSGRTKPYQFRKTQLENMKKFLKDNAQQLCEVLQADLRYVVLSVESL